MSTSPALFRQHYPAFADTNRYPDAQINFWILWAGLLLSKQRLSQPSANQVSQAGKVASGLNYVVNEVITLAGGTYSTPAQIQVTGVNAQGMIVAFVVSNVGVYTQAPTNPVGQASSTGNGTGALFALTFVSATPTLYDLATELFVAHNLALEIRTQDEAATGGVPGQQTGPLASKSVDKLSVGYDVNAGIEKDAGHWSLTVWGNRFIKLIRLRGMGPTFVGPPGPRGGLYGPPFFSPPIDQGWGFD